MWNSPKKCGIMPLLHENNTMKLDYPEYANGINRKRRFLHHNDLGCGTKNLALHLLKQVPSACYEYTISIYRK